MAHGHEYNELVRPAASMSSEHNAEWEADDASAKCERESEHYTLTMRDKKTLILIHFLKYF